MIMSVVYVLLAILGLSFLIFIHELGHYWMARRVGMRVETFAIGFGRPIYSWQRDGVTWQIGWLLFGGYVKIAGMETEGNVDPYSIPDGFFGKSPWARLKVAFMGPFVNLVFALIIFTLLWVSGGRNKNFAEFTHKIGRLDPESELYMAGVRPGDEIAEYDDYPFQSFKDHVYAPMVASETLNVKGFKINYLTGERTPFEYNVKPYSSPLFRDQKMVTAGILNPASYIVYEKGPGGIENPLPEGSPLKNSGIQYNDRLLWVDGKLIFSMAELSELLNDNRVLLTIKRDDKVFLRRVPRVKVDEIRPNAEFKEELIDWQHEAGIKVQKFQDLYALPYNLTYDGIVEESLRFIDKDDENTAFPQHLFSKEEEPLLPGDKIIASQGVPIKRSFELLKNIQEKNVSIIVERQGEEEELQSWKDEDASFYNHVNMNDLMAIVKTIGSSQPTFKLNNLVLFKPITPKSVMEFPMAEDAKAWLETDRQEKRKMIAGVEDPEKRRHLLKALEQSENTAVLGLPTPQDRKVVYNPKPTQMFFSVFQEIYRTLEALITGSLSPKYISGPVGIVQVVHSTSMVSLKESLFWIGAISLNLGMLNLLPIPVLDGGAILLSLFEMVTGRRMNQKILEKVVFVFAILLISFFVFLTYNDILRIFGSFFG